jgi:glycosyltransferase involved in cell wall biosynthesis
MAKIALITDRLGGRAGGGGAARQMLELGRGLRDLGHHVTIACLEYEAESAFSQSMEGLDVRAVHREIGDAPVGRFELLRRMRQGMSQVAELITDVDVVNGHEWPALRAARVASRDLKVPSVWTRNDGTIYERARLPNEHPAGPMSAPARVVRGAMFFQDYLDGRAMDAIVVLDTKNAAMVQRAYGRPARIVRSGPAAYFYDAPPRAEARARLGIPAGLLAVGVGILAPHRRLEDLVEAAVLAPEAHVRIVGSDHVDPAYADRLARLIEERAVGDRVELVRTSVPDEELRLLYAAADVFVFPNQRQTWGLAPLEAIAARTPAIVSAGAGVHEVLEGRPGVWVVPPARPDAIAQALREVMNGVPDGLEQTRAWVRDELNNRRYAEHMAEIYTELVSARRTT